MKPEGKRKLTNLKMKLLLRETILLYAGYIDKSVRGVWTLTEAGKTVEITAEMASDIFKKGVL